MPLGMEVGLRHGHIVLDGDLAPQRGTTAPNFRPMPIVPNGWMDRDAAWYTEVGLGPGHIVLGGEPAPPTERGTAAPQLFSACLSLLCSGRGFYAVVNYI